MKFTVVIAALLSLAVPALAAEDQKTVSDWLKAGYDIVSISSESNSYITKIYFRKGVEFVTCIIGTGNITQGCRTSK